MKKNCMRTGKNEIYQFFIDYINSNKIFDDTKVIFYSRYPKLRKKRARYEHFWPSYGVFFPGAPIESYFSISSCERLYPHSVSHEQGRAKLPDHLFPTQFSQ